ncbi:putative malate dehydrogenase 1B isoform X2 [Amia ocellicauda]|uniref:putative malate dehydrogenase 1B isoform X2 n=1 Tax=Amia ocellicauda TaxID=2972642 RepID=UPI003463967E
MAGFVLAGKADCPYYAKAELLADVLQRNLPSCSIHKICKHPEDWEGYYGISSDMMTDLMMKIATENLQTKKDIMEEEAYYKSLIQPLHVWITSALSPACYHLIPLLGHRGVFMEGSISLHLLDTSGREEELCSLKMETVDLALPLLHEVNVHTDLTQAFLHADVVIVLDDVQPEEEPVPRESAIKEISERCRCYGQLIDAHSRKGVRVIVAGDSFVNLKCYTLQQNSPSVSKHQFVAVAAQLENEARSELAKKLNVNSAELKDLIVWGNISGSFYIDLQRAKVFRYDGAIWGPPEFSQSVLDVIYDSTWLETDFLPSVSSHHQTVKAKIQWPTGLSAAHGIATVLQCWNQDSPMGEVLSLGVPSEGQFEIPEGLVFSMPVRFQAGTWRVLSDIEVNSTLKEKLKSAANELIAENKIAFGEKQL